MMEWGIKFEKDGSLISITASGIPDIEGFRSYLQAITSSPDWRPGIPVLCDLRNLDTSKVTATVIRGVVDLHVELTDRYWSSPVAVVVSRPVDFGMVRMFEAYTRNMCPEYEVFYSVEDALEWLRKNSRRAPS
ncbi:MAG TPA: hypothetical protein VMW38_13230 [Terriglobia bacterium]|nr:hypothetical protein [Terriglobia bacterium]